MKKAYYYDFLPTKAAEQAATARGMPYKVNRTLVELRDIYPPPKIDPTNPWQIRKCITTNEVENGKIMLSHQIAFDHVFRFWDMDLCNHVIAGSKSYVTIVDYTDENAPKLFKSPNIFFEMAQAPNDSYYLDTYFLGWIDVARSRVVRAGDEIGLFYEKSTGFGFKLLRRGKPVQVD